MDPEKQFQVVQSKFRTSDNPTKAILLSTFLKFINLYPQLKSSISPIFERNQTVIDQEIQQRACEYTELLKLNDEKLLGVVCDVMPAYENFKVDVPDLPSADTELEKSKPDKTDSQDSIDSKLTSFNTSGKSLLPQATPLQSSNPPASIKPMASSDDSENEKRRELEMRENLRRQQEQILERERQVHEQQQKLMELQAQKQAEMNRTMAAEDAADRRRDKDFRKMERKVQKKKPLSSEKQKKSRML
jgi:hypothetical protein